LYSSRLESQYLAMGILYRYSNIRDWKPNGLSLADARLYWEWLVGDGISNWYRL